MTPLGGERRALARGADVPDYTWFWWKLRPHPRLGTVEVRALDAPASLEDSAALVALTHEIAGMGALLRELTELTGAGAAMPGASR